MAGRGPQVQASGNRVDHGARLAIRPGDQCPMRAQPDGEPHRGSQNRNEVQEGSPRLVSVAKDDAGKSGPPPVRSRQSAPCDLIAPLRDEDGAHVSVVSLSPVCGGQLLVRLRGVPGVPERSRSIQVSRLRRWSSSGTPV